MRALARSFYARDVCVVAQDLLNKAFVCGALVGRIVEVEAYGGSDDPASHAFRGPTKRNAAMFGPPGHLYVYFTYGMHWCANVVCGAEGDASAVLLRAMEPVAGLETMRVRRTRARSDRDLLRGPARLAQAFAIDGDLNGHDVTKPSSLLPWIADDDVAPPSAPRQTSRIGVTNGTEAAWRWCVPSSHHVSRERT